MHENISISEFAFDRKRRQKACVSALWLKIAKSYKPVLYINIIIVGWSTKLVRSRRQARKNQPRSRVEILTAQTLSTTTATLSGLRTIGNETRSDEIYDSDSEDKFDYDDLCSNITQIAYFRDDPFICNKYIRCNHGYAQKFKCYRDTAWDIKRMTCLWVNNVDCGERQLVDPGLLGENDPDESMKHNGTRKTRTTRTTTTTTTTTTISTTTGR